MLYQTPEIEPISQCQKANMERWKKRQMKLKKKKKCLWRYTMYLEHHVQKEYFQQEVKQILSFSQKMKRRSDRNKKQWKIVSFRRIFKRSFVLIFRCTVVAISKTFFLLTAKKHNETRDSSIVLFIRDKIIITRTMSSEQTLKRKYDEYDERKQWTEKKRMWII